MKMKKHFILPLVAVAGLSLLIVSAAVADYILVKDVLSTSGGHLESSSYLLDYSTGQTAVGRSEGSSYLETGGFWSWSPWGEAVGVEEEVLPGTVPDRFVLSQNYPNPFNPQTHIIYQLPRAGRVTLTIYNVMGQAVRHLVNETRAAGEHAVTWQGLDDAGRPVASGIYFYQLTAGQFVEIRKMLLLK
jgi:hypothetical protein